jgi:hypothetical protein
MVHFTKVFIIATLAVAPALAAPLHFDQDDVDLMTREPFSLRRAFNRVRNVVRRVSNVARFVPGPIGMAAGVASRIVRREVEDDLYTRAVQDELDARGYDIQLDLREVDDVEARDISDTLSARDNAYTLRARAFVDSIEMEARSELSDDLNAREYAESPLDELD